MNDLHIYQGKNLYRNPNQNPNRYPYPYPYLKLYRYLYLVGSPQQLWGGTNSCF